MDLVKATQILLRHCGEPEDKDPLGDAAHSHSLLASLRPYSGLREELFHECLQASYIVCDEIVKSRFADPRLISNIWNMCSLSRQWGLHSDGMLRRNKLISSEDLDRLTHWINCLESLFIRSLYGKPVYYQAETYCSYIADYQFGDNVDFFFPYIKAYLEDDECSRMPSEVARGLATIGPLAKSFLPLLRELHERSYDWYSPTKRCTEESRLALKEAIAKIESEASSSGA